MMASSASAGSVQSSSESAASSTQGDQSQTLGDPRLSAIEQEATSKPFNVGSASDVKQEADHFAAAKDLTAGVSALAVADAAVMTEAPPASIAVLLQPRSYLHRWIRHPPSSHHHPPASSSSMTSTSSTTPYDTYNPAEASPDHLFERPERLRAINVGLAALVARLEHEGAEMEERGSEEEEAAAAEIARLEAAWLAARRELDVDPPAAAAASLSGAPVVATGRTATKRERRQAAAAKLAEARGAYEQAMWAAARDRQRRGRGTVSGGEYVPMQDQKTEGGPSSPRSSASLAPRPAHGGTMLGRHIFLAPITTQPRRDEQGAPSLAAAAPASTVDTSASTSSSRSSRSSRLRPSTVAANISAAASSSQILRNPAVAYAHADPSELRAPFPRLSPASTTSSSVPRPSYLRDLVRWALEAPEAIKRTGCEIPSDRTDMNANDLYLGPGSVDAIEGCIETVCAAVDLVVAAEAAPQPASRSAFCAIRPPGHHCGSDSPSGFCYINNVVVGAMHAYLAHDIDRAVILDFDLHHGNGTQSIVMGLNDVAQTSPDGVGAAERRGWRGFYGSLHDIYSYPCEGGDLDLIKDASVNLAAHGQYISNIHLRTYTDETDFYRRLYPRYLDILQHASHFIAETDADPSKTMVFISAGFDACEHEHDEMQRHGRRVPASFFARFTADVAAWARKHCHGRIVSVLEGGYSDEALTTGVMAHLSGFLPSSTARRDGWWTEDAALHYASCTAKKRTGELLPLAADTSPFPWSSRLNETMRTLQEHEGLVYKTAPKPAPMYRSVIKTRSAAATPEAKKQQQQQQPQQPGKEGSATTADLDLEAALASMSLSAAEEPTKAPKLVFTFKKEP